MLALAAACGDRVVRVYEEFWVGSHTPRVSESIDLAWAAACDSESPPADALADSIEEVADFVAYYHEEGIGMLASVVTTSLRILQCIASENDEDAAIAACRACGSSLYVAIIADSCIHGRRPDRPRPGDAESEERSWQEAAIERIREPGAASRGMFDDLGPTPPVWWTRYQTAPFHL
ncbi:MAG: hypothetical protein SangKO_026030 [Sandaracinaceae bacterium]